jgi:hypothetical protein
MCFSAEASFAGGIIILAIGVATVTKVHKSSQLVFASIPLFFGIQQITEGILWSTLSNPDYTSIQKFSTYLFLFMADVLWPMMIPLSVLFMEENIKKKKNLRLFLLLGACLSAYYATCLALFEVNPEIMGYHIHYNTNFPKSLALGTFAIYLTVTIIPLFISSIKKTHLLGVLMFLSCAVTVVFFRQYLTSVWCFFAAIISGVIFWILRDSKRIFNLDKLILIKNKLKTSMS